MVRKAAVAGAWYPGRADALAADIDKYVAAASPAAGGHVRAIVTPHAGLMFSGPVAAWAWKAAVAASPDLIVLAGPSHYVGFHGVSVWPDGAFETPLGPIAIDADAAAALLAHCEGAQDLPVAHAREHSLEMQLPFIRRLLPRARLLPIVMGWQTRETIGALASALPSICKGRRAIVAASTDLSHFFEAGEAARLDRETIDRVERMDTEGLLTQLEQYPEEERGRFVGCGAGPMVSVLMAAQAMGAASARTLRYANSGDISGDMASVVGYLAAAIGGPEA